MLSRTRWVLPLFHLRLFQNSYKIVRDINSTQEYIKAFQLCKELLTSSPILAYPDFTKQFTLTTDASNVGIGSSVLSQNNRPIEYYSRILNSAERNYSIIKKKLLAIIDSIKHFRPYLYGRKFVIETCHKPLVWLFKIKEPNSRLISWKIKLEEFDFDFRYKKGKENTLADALSRIEVNHLDSDTASVQVCIDEEDARQFINQQNPNDEDLDEILYQAIENLGEYQHILQDLEELHQSETYPYKLELAGPMVAKRLFDTIHIDYLLIRNLKVSYHNRSLLTLRPVLLNQRWNQSNSTKQTQTLLRAP